MKIFNKLYKCIVIGSRKRKLHIKNKSLVIGKNTFVDKTLKFEVGKNCWIGKNISFLGNGTIKIGDDVHIGDNCKFYCSNSTIEIGNLTLIAPDCFFITSDHVYSSKDLPIQKQGNSYGDIFIGEDCWLGQNATILKGTTIEAHSIIGSKSLAKGKFEKESIYAGIPAKFIKKRY